MTVLLAAVLITGAGLLAYPTFSDWWNRTLAAAEIRSYIETIDIMDDSSQEQMRAEAEAYNDSLREAGGGNFTLTEEEYAVYESVLDVTGTGIMSYLEIPAIDVYLPIYHGTQENVLQAAVGHLEGSSLPVGGAGTHAVLAGHTGLPGARLLTDLDQLEIGDIFRLYTLGTTLTYEVDQILVVLPDEVGELAIREGEDLVTLVTCTPYGINSHRLLVRGHRIANEVTDVSIHSWEDSGEVRQMGYFVLGMALAVLALAFAALLLAALLPRSVRPAQPAKYDSPAMASAPGGAGEPSGPEPAPDTGQKEPAESA